VIKKIKKAAVILNTAFNLNLCHVFTQFWKEWGLGPTEEQKTYR